MIPPLNSPLEPNSWRQDLPSSPSIAPRLVAGLILFGLPLFFGGGDAATQAGALLLLCAGFLIHPPRVEAMPLKLAVALGIFLALFIFKDLIPSSWVATPKWRSILITDYSLSLTGTRHPEPWRIVEETASILGAIAWFWWIRSLLDEPEHRPVIAWMIFLSGSLIAVVSFIARYINPELILGIRPSQGFQGFGTFPNRNHTACLLAMSSLTGIGCVIDAWKSERWPKVILGACLLVPPIAGLFASGSRGGLAAFSIGMLVLGLLAFLRTRHRMSRMPLGAWVGCGVWVLAAFLLLQETSTIHRLLKSDGISLKATSRADIWTNTVELISDAPWLGHGADTFQNVFPLYERISLVNQKILHPESSYLLACAEWGIPLTLFLFALIFYVLWGHLRRLLKATHHPGLRYALVAALVAGAFHGLWDVPLHRWGTSWMWIAILALICPIWMRREVTRSPARYLFVILPGIPALWLSLCCFSPQVTPGSVHALATMNQSLRNGASIDINALEKMMSHYPLTPELHHYWGIALEPSPRFREEMWRQFRLANALAPSDWRQRQTQARIAQNLKDPIAFYFWAEAFEKSGHRRYEIFQIAISETTSIPGSVDFWKYYSENHPDLLLVFASTQPSDQWRPMVQQWWTLRSSSENLAKGEIDILHMLASKGLSLDQFNQWRKLHAENTNEYKQAWARVLLEFGEAGESWNLLRPTLPPDIWSTQKVFTPRAVLEQEWRVRPENWTNTQQLAILYHQLQLAEERDSLLAKAVKLHLAPLWFRQAYASLLAHQERLKEAATILLGP